MYNMYIHMYLQNMYSLYIVRVLKKICYRFLNCSSGSLLCGRIESGLSTLYCISNILLRDDTLSLTKNIHLMEKYSFK